MLKKLEKKLVERVDNKVFQNYRERYDMYDKELQELMKDIPKIKN